MTTLAGRVLATLRRRGVCARGATVLVAVSGGADSVALTHLLAELSAAGAVTLIGLVHVDHRLRGDESTRDREFCRALAANLRVDCHVEVIEVAAEAARLGLSVEDAARRVRYDIFERVRTRTGADVVAVAHTRDDQAETVLLRLLQGAGTRGLRGILPTRDGVMRPLLDFRHAELVAYLEAQGRDWVEDSTNRDTAIPRNWVRHDLLPLLTTRAGEGLVDALARTAEGAREDENWLGQQAAQATDQLVRPAGGARALDAAGLTAQPPAIGRRVVRSVLESMGGGRVTWAHIEAVLELARSGQTGVARVGRSEVELSAATGVLCFRGSPPAGHVPAAIEPRELAIPGTLDVPEAGLRLRAECRDLAELGGLEALRTSERTRAVVTGTVGSRLLVRGWNAGDALQPLGLSGRKKVQDLFVDRKVPRGRRRAVPIVTAPDGRIVWVAGHAMGDPFRVTPATKAVVVLSFEPLEAL